MPIADVLIAVAVVISVLVGLLRGFVKEALSVATLLIAVWAAFSFGSYAGRLTDQWIASGGLQLWLGRLLVFLAVLVAGGLLGWGVSRMVRLSVLSGTDRALGGLFGFLRGALLTGLFVIGGQLASFDRDAWWQESRLIPYGSLVADWIRVMAPRGIELISPPESADETVTVTET